LKGKTDKKGEIAKGLPLKKVTTRLRGGLARSRKKGKGTVGEKKRDEHVQEEATWRRIGYWLACEGLQ